MSVEVTQADRDAACAYLSGIAYLRGKDAIREIYDDHPAVTFAASVRHQAEEAMRERCAKVAEIHERPTVHGNEIENAAGRHCAKSIAFMIRSIDTRGE